MQDNNVMHAKISEASRQVSGGVLNIFFRFELTVFPRLELDELVDR